MNTLEVIATIEPLTGDDSVSERLRQQVGGALWQIQVRLEVDGQAPPRTHPDDVACLLGLSWTHSDGTPMLVNCVCGNFGCGGYYRGFEVRHQLDGTVRWRNLDRTESPVLTFEAAQAGHAIDGAIATIRRRLVELRGQRVEFRCWDDAEVFGLTYDDSVYPGIQVPADFGA